MKKLFGVMGDPIYHSLSPQIHNDAFEKLGIDACYHHFHVCKEDLGIAVHGLKAIGISGFNVTVPHKTEIIAFLDEIDALALAIGAVNTVVNVDGKLKGYNTDGIGYTQALKSVIGPSVTDKKTLVIGAGGAARAIYYTLASEGVREIDISNRTVGKAQQLISECPYEAASRALSIEEAERSLGDYDVIIQTTSVGMSPKLDETPLNMDRQKKGVFVSDIIYNPLQTKLLKDAGAMGAQIQNGMEMFVQQAAFAFELWTGIYPDPDRMRNIVRNNLGGAKC